MRAIDADAVKALIDNGISTDTEADREYVKSLIDELPTVWEEI